MNRTTITTGIGAVLLLALTGCGGGDTSAPSTPVTPAAAPTTSAAAAATPATAGGGACTVDDLTAALQERPSNDSARRIVVIWTNSSDRTCTMTGFGGVDLRGPDDPTFGPVYSLPRSSETPRTVTLAAQGGRAETPIVFLPPTDGTPGWTPDEIVATPPDETRSETLPWTLGPVLRQDAATRPGTFLQPVVESVR